MTITRKASGYLSRLARLARRAPRSWQPATVVLCLIALCSIILADERIIRIARISLIEGEVSYQRANDSKKDWFDATLNLPLDESDQLYSGPAGRAEIQLSGRNLVRIDRDTNLRFTQFNTGTIQLALPVGTATFRIDSLDRRQFQIVDARDGNQDEPVYFEVDTPTAAITFLKEGNYRVNVREDGTTEVIVRRGQAEVYNQELGAIVVKQGRRIIVEGRDNNYQLTRLEDKDNWDRWNDRRDDELFARVDSYRSQRYVPAALPGVYDLDTYGDWVETSDYGWVWSPRGVATGWAPYRTGYWRWYQSYGWTWISSEPWGWVPYHYGRWAYWGSRWCWVPRVSSGLDFDWGWRPHLVTFFGWGGRYSRGYRDGFYDGYRAGQRDGWFGWCPLGPRDRYHGYDPRTNRILNDNYPRSVESLANYNAPGGVGGMESRRFDQGRVVVSNDAIITPPRGAGRTADQTPVVAKADDLKPSHTPPSRNALVERAEVARRIEAPVVVRRNSPETGGTPSPTREGRVIRDGTVTPARGVESQASSPTRVSDGQIQRSDRPTRYTDYRPVERTDAPVRREPGEGRGTDGTSRDATPPSRNEDRPVERSIERPSRSDSPSRNQPEPRRIDPPSRPPERMPERQPERQVDRPKPEPSAPPREYRRPDPPPAREPMPSRSSERPSSPPPRESAPPRNVEKPSSPPPSRESSPARPERPESPERSMPSRKTDPQ